MKTYKVKVNGKLFEVELEAVSETTGTIEKSTTITPSTSTGSNAIVAPISGKVLQVKVKVGDRISKGQTIAIIEAMKLENEVPATADGIVREIKVSTGSEVTSGDIIVVLG